MNQLRNTTALGALLVVICSGTWAQDQQVIDIPAQPLLEAVAELSAETGTPILVRRDLLDGAQGVRVIGPMSPRQALERMVAETNLSVREMPDKSLVLSDNAQMNFVSQNATEDPFDLGTLVLTSARRTTEAVRDVPGNVAVLSGETLDASNISDFEDAVDYLPNVNIGVNSDPRRATYSIRGISSLNIAATAPTIGVFQDGVLQNGTGQRYNINPSLRDVERVEISYGPQGTSYGRGTVAGAINIVTAKPVFEQDGAITFRYNDLNEIDAEVMFNTPLSDTVAVRGVLYGADMPGFIAAPNAPETNFIGSDNAGGRLSLRWQPNAQFTLDASIQHDESSFDGSFFADAASVLSGNPIQFSNTVPGIDIERTNGLLNLAYETDVGTFISTTGWLNSSLVGVEDFDLGPAPEETLRRDDFEDTFSQEFRFESRDLDIGTGTIAYNLGLSYSEVSSRSVNDFSSTNFFGGGPGSFNGIDNTDTENLALYGDIRWQATPQLEITVGGRYSRDEVSVQRRTISTGSLVFDPDLNATAEKTFSSFTPSISALYNWNENITTYATYSTGYKPGGFVEGDGTLTQFNEENVENFEVGLKASFLDDRLRVNASVYSLRYDDIQVPIRFDPSNGFFGGVENAARAKSEGFELFVGADLLPGLTIEGAFGYNDARFTDYRNSSFGDISGSSLPNAPRRNYSLVLDYEFQGDFRGKTPFIRGEILGRSEFQPEVGSTVSVGDYNIANLRAGFRSDELDITFFVENVTDEIYAVDSSFENLAPGQPRTFGVLASLRF